MRVLKIKRSLSVGPRRGRKWPGLLMATALLAALGSPVSATTTGTTITDDGYTVDASGITPAAAIPLVDGAVMPEVDGPELLSPEIESSPPPPVLNKDLTIIGSDNRTRVTPTTTKPYKWLVHIYHEATTRVCSGFMLDPNFVVTAGHCVHTGGSSGAWYARSGFKIRLAKDGGTNPYGTCGAALLVSQAGWTVDGLYNHDYGGIKLNCTRNVGNIGTQWSTNSRANLGVRLTGYPAEKAWGTMWTGAGYIKGDTPRTLSYSNDFTGGQSGSPVYYKNATYGHLSIAVAAHHATGATDPDWNSGPEITQQVFNNIHYWKTL